ncbi:MAG: hypothetical protein E6G27_05530 [Actinobacteria bacterium]|nr:MAG: hypothetical protein E6G27_05530 [Actinomycetota bacterium]
MPKPKHPLRRIVLRLDVVPGPITGASASRLLRLAVEDLRAQGADVRRARVKITGKRATWWG